MISVILDGNGTPGEIGVNDHPALHSQASAFGKMRGKALDRAPVERGFFCSQAKADNFRNMKYIAKIKIILRSVLTVFQNHFTASGSPVDFVLPTFSLFSG